MKVCDYCGEYPASVFTSEHPLCRRCYGEIRAAEMVDNEVPNAPVCPDCGGLMPDNRPCLPCYELALHVFVNGMVSVG